MALGMRLIRNSAIVQVNRESLIPAKHHFNCAICEWAGYYVFAYRIEHEPVNTKTRVAICKLGPDLQPIFESNRVLDLPTIYGGYIAEDPRLVQLRGRLYCNYTDRGSMALALISDMLTVAAGNYISYDRQSSVEKNWGIFEHENELFAVHTINPHRVLQLNIDFVKGHSAHLRFECPYSCKWVWGIPRGGSPPVRVGDEYFCFFHSHIESWQRRLYLMGAYAFAARPPFKVTRFSRFPILLPPYLSFEQRGVNGHLVVFPCGAIYSKERWLVSYGENDMFCKLFAFEHKALLDLMD
jgi:predicted GH43/DUF377 family glycosyl hydrolase